MNSIPPGVWNAIDYERLAVQSMDAGRYAYVAGGCGWDRRWPPTAPPLPGGPYCRA